MASRAPIRSAAAACRHPTARISSRSNPLIAPRLEISLSSIRQKHPPGALEIGAGLVEGGGRAVLLLARLRSRIETAMPLPRILIMRLPVLIAIVPAWISP